MTRTQPTTARRPAPAVTEQADVSIAKSGPATANAGDTITYVITTTNAGPSTAAGVVATDSLPSGLTAEYISRGGSQAGQLITWPSISFGKRSHARSTR